MKRKTRKLFIIAIAALLVIFLFTCKPFADGNDVVTYTDVEYSPDGRSITIYLDGSTPVRQKRALTHRLAVLGHDFFEVAFLSADGVIARASWEANQAAGVTGIQRGVNYSSANPNGLSGNNGAAIIFVGKRSDRTLLAVGRLAGTDDGGDGVTTITPSTRSVTFSVVAFEAGTDPFPASSSFLTAAGDNSFPHDEINISNTVIYPDTLVGRNRFPLYLFPHSRTIYARYTINAYVSNVSVIGDYVDGIRVAGAWSYGKKRPQYPLGNGQHENTAIFYPDLEGHTDISITNNAIGGPFQNGINFRFVTDSRDDGKVNSFYFEIPVYPLSSSAGPGQWYIRPGYDSYLWDLDDGNGGTGGAILYGIGDLTNLTYDLRIATKPPKKNYNNNPYTYNFDPEGLVAYMQVGSYRVHRVYYDGSEGQHVWFSVGDSYGTPEVINIGDDLSYFFTKYGGSSGMLVVTMHYDDDDDPSTQTYTDFFVLYDSDLGDLDLGDIPEGNRILINNSLDAIFLYNRIDNTQSGGTYIMVFNDSFDLPPVVFNYGHKTVILLAAKPGLTVGRASGGVGGGGFVHYVNSTDPNIDNNYFLGVWPFNEPIVIGGKAITDYPYAINTTGSFTEVVKNPADLSDMDQWTAPTTFSGAGDGFIRIQSGSSVNILPAGGVKIINSGFLEGYF